ncbi:uncharacterized protein METZ01_LOCUS137419 [marine metagenome]|uniref:Uncharacterized protein n=1 Tax=marine metagenome TaxID=408172 RepID=A0A381Z5I9_9ZZZZ
MIMRSASVEALQLCVVRVCYFGENPR